MNTEPPKVLSLQAMARRLRIPARELKAAAEAGDVVCVRVGGALMFNAAVVERALADRAAKGVSDER